MRRLRMLAAPTVVVWISLILVGGGCGTSSSSVRGSPTSQEVRPNVALPGAEIVFTRSIGDSARSDLYVMAADDSHARLLVRNAAEPAISPDGRRIAFVRGHAIWLVRRDGLGQRQLTKPDVSGDAMVDSSPAWSADGKRVYFEHWVRKAYAGSIFSIRGDGTSLRRLTRALDSTGHGHCHDSPAPSPDGRLVVFADNSDCEHATPSYLAAVTVAGRPATLPFKMARVAGDEYTPAWAPNGRMLAYTVFDFDYSAPEKVGSSGIWVSSSDGRPPRRIVRGLSVTLPAWSPDGAWVAYSDQSRGIRLVRKDGSQARPLALNGWDAAWLPVIR